MISVLLVDDDPALLEVTRTFLEKTGLFTVDTCLTAPEALCLVEKKRYDVVVSDYEMPVMNGIQLLKELKRRNNIIPFIIFTGKGQEQVVIDALNNGAIFYLVKGNNPHAQFLELSHKCLLAAEQRFSEISLKDSEKKYRTLVERELDGILITDVQGTILFANTSSAKMLGADGSPALAGMNVLELIAPEFHDAVIRDIVELARGRDAFVAEYEAVTVTGTRIAAACLGKAISHNGRPAILILIRRIASIKSAEKGFFYDETLWHTFIKNADYGMFIIMGDRIRYANPYMTTITGYSPETLQNIGIWDIIHKNFHGEVKERISGCQNAGKDIVDHTDVTLITPGGREHQVRLGIIPVEFGEKPAILCTALDVTDQRSAESRLDQLNKKLHLLNEVTHHDLLNNFTALFGYFEIIKENTVDQKNLGFMKKQEVILSAIHEQINFTGYYQHIGNQKPVWQYGENAIRDAASLLPLERVTLRHDLGRLQIYADPLLIRVFYNLMENALRHGEHVTEIRYFCEKRPQGCAIVYEDNGIGIPAKNKERIFSKGMGKNSGLGLFLIKEILAITKMTIRENGKEGTGARFEIFIPDGMFRHHVPESPRL